MIILMRIVAQIIDIAISLVILICSILYVFPFLTPIFPDTLTGLIIVAVCVLILDMGILFLLNYPFLVVNQTIGKAFASLEMISVNPTRPLNILIILQREIFCKLMSCYFICIPVLFGKKGWHEAISETEVIVKRRRG